MSTDRLVEITLNLIQGAVGSNTVGIPAIITNEAPASGFGSGYAKLYKTNELSTVGTDFSTGGVTYAAAQKLTSPSPKVNQFYVIKRGATTAGVVTLTFAAGLGAGDVITGTVNGNAISVTYATSVAATLTALAAAIQALTEVTTAASNGTDTITITFAAEWTPAVGTFTAAGGGEPVITTATVTPAVNIANDIDNALAETATNLWFMLLPTQSDTSVILAAAAKIESLSEYKMMGATSTATGIYDSGSTTDVASIMESNGYNRSFINYHDDSTEYIHTIIASRCLSVAPGQVAFKHKRLTGATPAPLTGAQISIVEGKKCNTYTQAGPFALFLQGVVSSGVSIEAIRDIFYFLQELQLALYNVLVTRDKVPYNESGRQLGLAAGNGVVQRMITEGVLNPDADPQNEFIMTEIADISETDRGNHVFPSEVVGEHLASATKFRVIMNIKVS